jgi:hypothetical protein
MSPLASLTPHERGGIAAFEGVDNDECNRLSVVEKASSCNGRHG